MSKYGIWCRVSGGVTGTRESWMKANGEVQLFDDYEAANKEAMKIEDQRMGNPHRKADFSYRAKEYNSFF